VHRSDEHRALPIFLAGCKELVVLAGFTYTSRLWCVLEIFTWLFMGGRIDQITVVPLLPLDLEGVKEAATTSKVPAVALMPPRYGMICCHEMPRAGPQAYRQEILGSFRSFDAAAAKCFRPGDKDKILGLIAQGCGTLEGFSEIVRLAFTQAAETSFTRPFATTVDTPRGLRGSIIASLHVLPSRLASRPEERRSSGSSWGSWRRASGMSWIAGGKAPERSSLESSLQSTFGSRASGGSRAPRRSSLEKSFGNRASAPELTSVAEGALSGEAPPPRVDQPACEV